MVQVRRLAVAYEKYEHFYFTFSGGVAEGMKKNDRVLTIPDVTRKNPVSWFAGLVLSFFAAAREKPDVVISTGAGVTVFFCIFAKLFGAKLIFLESIAKKKLPTWTARILYPFADLFLVQWPELIKFFPRARFVGRLF